jgi:hypothetical protein
MRRSTRGARREPLIRDGFRVAVGSGGDAAAQGSRAVGPRGRPRNPETAGSEQRLHRTAIPRVKQQNGLPVRRNDSPGGSNSSSSTRFAARHTEGGRHRLSFSLSRTLPRRVCAVVEQSRNDFFSRQFAADPLTIPCGPRRCASLQIVPLPSFLLFQAAAHVDFGSPDEAAPRKN